MAQTASSLDSGEFRSGGKAIESDLIKSTHSFKWTIDAMRSVRSGVEFVDVSFVDGLRTGRACCVWVRQGPRWLIREVRIAPGPEMQR
jgi:hypothetical protein